MSAQGGSKVWMIVAIVAVIGLIISIATRPEAPSAPQAGEAPGTPSAKTDEKPEKSAPELPSIDDKQAKKLAKVRNPGGGPEAPPVGGKMGMAVEVPTGASPVMVPGAPTSTNMPSHVQADRGESGAPFPFKGKDAVEQYLSKRIDDAGEDKLNRYLSATYAAMTSEPSAAVSSTIAVAAGKGAVLTFPEARVTYRLDGARCLEDSDGVVMECTYLDAARAWLYRGAHDSTVLLPLRKAPYSLVKAEEIFAKEDARETTSKRYLYAIAGTDFTLVVLQDPDDLRSLGVHVRSPRLEKMGIDSLRCTMSGWEKIDGVMFARRWHVHWRVGEHTSGQVAKNSKPYSVVVTGIAAGAAAAMTPPPALSKVGAPVRFAPRPTLSVVAQEADAKQLFPVWMKLREALPPNRLTLDHGLLVQVDGTGLSAAIDPRSATRAMSSAGFRAIGAAQTARKLFKIPVEAIPAAIDAFSGEVQRSGKKLADGPRIARVLRWPPIPAEKGAPVVGDSVVELQLPLAGN